MCWFGILADVAPSNDELVYAHSPRGFALLNMRSPSVSRLYLQVPNGTDPVGWADERIWDEPDARFAIDGDWTLERGAHHLQGGAADAQLRHRTHARGPGSSGISKPERTRTILPTRVTGRAPAWPPCIVTRRS